MQEKEVPCSLCSKNPVAISKYDMTEHCKLFNPKTGRCPLDGIPQEELIKARLAQIQQIRLMITKIDAEMRRKGVVRDNLSTDQLEKDIRKLSKHINWCHASTDLRGNLMRINISLYTTELPTVVKIINKCVTMIEKWFTKNHITYKGTSGYVCIHAEPNATSQRIDLWVLKGQKVKTICCARDVSVKATTTSEGFFFCSQHSQRVLHLELKETLTSLKKLASPLTKRQLAQLNTLLSKRDCKDEQIEKFVESFYPWGRD